MKLSYLLLVTVLITTLTVQSQTFKLLPNPDTASEGFSGYYATELNGALYTAYKNTLGRYQLAKFDGKKTTLYNNPDTGSIEIIYDYGTTATQLFFLYKDSANPYNVYSIVKFDGKKLSHLPLPAHYNYSSNYWYGPPFITLKNNLYTLLNNDTVTHQILGRYDSSTNTFVPINTTANYFSGNAYCVYNNILYMIQYSSKGYELFQYDGNKITVRPLVDSSTSELINYAFRNMVGYNGNIYFVAQAYDTAQFIYAYHLYRFNGTKITKIPDNPDNTIDLSNAYDFTLFNNNLYFNYYNKTHYTNLLGWYDGISTHVLNNPDNGRGVNEGQFAIYNNALYLTYNKANGKNYLAKYNGSNLAFYNNPDSISKGVDGCGIFNNHLYLGYARTGIDSNKFNLGRFTDTGFMLFKTLVWDNLRNIFATIKRMK